MELLEEPSLLDSKQTNRLKSSGTLTQTDSLQKRIEELELYRVRDTQFEQPFFLRLFGLGNVILLTTDTTSPEVIVPAIPNAQAIREQIRYAVEETRDSKRVRVAELE
jgi:hypothetical protein